MNTAPVVLFVYNRPWHTRQTIEALQANPEAAETDLFIFSDAAKNEQAGKAVAEVRSYLHQIAGFRSLTIVEREENYGLAKSVVDGVTPVCRKHGRVIVLEDDIMVAPYFLKYMNEALACYQDDERVISISGYTYPIKHELPETFFLRGADCWGWATWSRAWNLYEPDGKALLAELRQKGLTNQFDSNGTYPFTKMLENQVAGRNNSWAVRWHASAFLKNRYTLYPRQTLVHNIGVDGSGENCAPTDAFYGGYSATPIKINRVPVEEHGWVRKLIMQFHRKINPPLPIKIMKRLAELMSGAGK